MIAEPNSDPIAKPHCQPGNIGCPDGFMGTRTARGGAAGTRVCKAACSDPLHALRNMEERMPNVESTLF
ncbi:hypothetical protein HII28_11915 [Planctomonas sp. JC2975]|uniref:hypothetical protein n=1 Tax=Planctomonas sp. JC2975 TaxID=2729626 RepID=UPI00147677D3|nr:hypothetical protein [Planctomonas sp. JC2975]NNC12581.1 hypothetical protein [Planctomonas sp. JC2975]